MKPAICRPSHVLDLRKAVVAGSHLQAANEPTATPSEADFLAADLARDIDKGERLARRGDAAALDLQLNGHAFASALRFAEGLKPVAEG